VLARVAGTRSFADQSSRADNFGFPYCHQGDIADQQFGWGHSCNEFTKPIALLSTVRHHAGDRPASFLADFLGNCAIAFPICPLMLQKCAFRYFGPTIILPGLASSVRDFRTILR
jgi:hypothetical protein